MWGGTEKMGERVLERGGGREEERERESGGGREREQNSGSGEKGEGYRERNREM